LQKSGRTEVITILRLGSAFDDLNKGGVVEVAVTLIDERLEEVADDLGSGGGDVVFVGEGEGDVEVFEVKARATTGLKVALDHARAVIIEDAAGSKAVEHSAARGVHVHACFVEEDKPFGDSSDGDADEHLVNGFGDLPCSRRADVDDGGAEMGEDWQGAVKALSCAADHDGEGGLLRADGSAGHGRVEHFDAECLGALGELAREGGIVGGHVNEEESVVRAVKDAVFARDDLIYGGRVGEHGDDNIGLGGELGGGRGGACALRDELLYCVLTAVVDNERIAGAEEMLRHGFAHESETDEADGVVSH